MLGGFRAGTRAGAQAASEHQYFVRCHADAFSIAHRVSWSLQCVLDLICRGPRCQQRPNIFYLITSALRLVSDVIL